MTNSGEQNERAGGSPRPSCCRATTARLAHRFSTASATISHLPGVAHSGWDGSRLSVADIVWVPGVGPSGGLVVHVRDDIESCVVLHDYVAGAARVDGDPCSGFVSATLPKIWLLEADIRAIPLRILPVAVLWVRVQLLEVSGNRPCHITLDRVVANQVRTPCGSGTLEDSNPYGIPLCLIVE